MNSAWEWISFTIAVKQSRAWREWSRDVKPGKPFQQKNSMNSHVSYGLVVLGPFKRPGGYEPKGIVKGVPGDKNAFLKRVWALKSKSSEKFNVL